MSSIYNDQQKHLQIEVYPIGDLASNCTLVYSNETYEALIFDPGNNSDGLISLINYKKLQVKKLIHTHAHFDHIGQTSEVQDYTKASTYLHREDLPLYTSLKEHAMMFGQRISNQLNPIDNFISDNEYIGFDDDNYSNLFRIIHVPGHSPGGCCFYTEYFSNPLLIAGDALFQGSIGRTDLPGGNHHQFITEIKSRLLTLPDNTNVITGHGPCTTIGNEKKWNPFLS